MFTVDGDAAHRTASLIVTKRAITKLKLPDSPASIRAPAGSPTHHIARGSNSPLRAHVMRRSPQIHRETTIAARPTAASSAPQYTHGI
jgi:hypothetical protein